MNPTVTHDLSIISLLLNASVLVQLVMAALLLASLFSWYYIFIKRFQLARATRQADEFEKHFWSGAELSALYHRRERFAQRRDARAQFRSGFREFTKLTKQPGMDSQVWTAPAGMSALTSARWTISSLTSLSSRRGLGQPVRGSLRHGLGIMNAFRGLATWPGDARPRRSGIAEP